MRRLAPVCLALCVFVTPAAAEPITLQFTGTLNSVDPDVAHALDIGDSFEFALTYETGPPRSTGSLFNIYDGTIAGRIGGYSFDSMSAGTGILASKRSGGLSFEYDGFAALFGNALPGGWRGRALIFDFFDPLTTPGELPGVVGPEAAMQFGFYYARPDPSGNPPEGKLVAGQADSIHKVPEPGALLLLSLGVLGFVPRVSRRLLRKRS